MSLTRAQKIVAEAYRDCLGGPQGRVMQDDMLMWLIANPAASASQFYHYMLSRLSLPRRDALLNGDIKPRKPMVTNLEGA